MKRFVCLLVLMPLLSWAGVDGLWKDGKGSYWVLFHEAAGGALAVELDATLTRSNVWTGSVAASTLQLTSLSGATASLTANSTSTALSGTVSGQAFSAATLLAHFGGGYDAIYSAGAGRYLVYLTLKDGSASGNGVLLLDLSFGANGLSHQVYWGQFAPSTRKLSGASLTSAGATADLTFDEAGAISGRLSGASLSATPLIYQVLPEGVSDYLGYYLTSPGYSLLSGKAVKVVNLPEEESFFAVYTPGVVQKTRVMVVVHGTDGTPYEELKDEVDYANQYGYVVLGVQWHNKAADTYATPKSVYRTIGKALDHLKRTTGNDLTRVAYVGFSRGSAISYEVSWRDRESRKLFDLTVSHSGGIPTELPVAPQGDDPGVFYNALTKGTLGGAPMSGTKFFLYCGEKDEQFGAQMCQWVNNAKTLIERNAGSVVRLIDDPVGKHAGYRANPSNHTAGVQAFIDATP
jgi:hypothetical protein